MPFRILKVFLSTEVGFYRQNNALSAVAHSNELLPTLQQALTQPGPVLIDVPIDYSDNAEMFLTVDESAGN